MPMWTMVAIVPDMFHTPIRPPTISRMKIADMAAEIPCTIAVPNLFPGVAVLDGHTQRRPPWP